MIHVSYGIVWAFSASLNCECRSAMGVSGCALRCIFSNNLQRHQTVEAHTHIRNTKPYGCGSKWKTINGTTDVSLSSD